METTSESQPGFFSQGKTQRAIDNFLARFESISADGNFEEKRNKYIKIVLSSIKGNSQFWDSYASINAEFIGNHFVKTLENLQSGKTKEELDHIFAMLFRFLLEADISTGGLNYDDKEAIDFCHTNFDQFSPDAQKEIAWASKQMPILMVKNLLHDEKLQFAIKMGIKGAEAVDKINKWGEELAAREKRVQDLNDTLAKHETAFNFVGLFDGFNRMSKTKRWGQAYLGLLVSILGIFTISLTLYKVWLVTQNPPDPSSLGTYLTMIPSITLIVVLVYFFRVAVMEYKSVKSQLLQIELRKTLCQFIQSYCTYSQEIKTKDKEALARFEQIIFSGIVSDANRIPTAFDGLEQLIQTIKAATKP
ncbi:MAG: hypothetical protein ABIK45_05475 [Pseudomonadota bacterium]